ncbi:MAG TPA: hypothetical protein VJZ51_03615 [Bacilli bacterium]|nr:hypothetical protein [Bacilli bacterium]
MVNKCNNKGLFALYSIYILIVCLITIPALTFFIGVDWFSTESIYIIYLGGVAFVNALYVIVKTSGILVGILLSLIINKKLFKITKTHDSLLEDNVTVIKAYDKYKIDLITLVPYMVDLVIAYFSYFWLLKNNPNFAIIVLMLLSFWEMVIVKTTTDNLVGLYRFAKSTNNI